MTDTDTAAQAGRTLLPNTLDVAVTRLAANTPPPRSGAGRTREGALAGGPGAGADSAMSGGSASTAANGRPDRSRAPATGDQLFQRADGGARYAEYASRWHDSRATLWGLVDTWARLLVAVAASLSALSLVTSSAIVTATLSVLTAVASALNAALEPAQKEGRNRRAAADYRPLARDLGALATETMSLISGHEETVYADGAYRGRWVGPPGLTSERLAGMASDLQDLEIRLYAIMDAAPSLNRTKRPDYAPRTRYGLQRMARRLARKQQALMVEDAFNQSQPLDDLTALHIPELLPRTRWGMRRLEKRLHERVDLQRALREIQDEAFDETTGEERR